MTSLADFLQRQSVWRGGALAAPAAPAVPSGYAALDAELPGGGWPAGALTEILCAQQGVGELQLVLPALAALTAEGRRIAWLAPPHLPYAPALEKAGVNLEYLIVVRAPGRRDALWAAEQVLRSGACHALLAWLPQARYAELQRLTVAAQANPGFAALFRPPAAASEASPAALRLVLEGDGERLSARILKRRGAPTAAAIHLPVRLSQLGPLHALGRPAFQRSSLRDARASRRLGLPVHA